MRINVKLFGILRDRLPASQKGKTVIELQEGDTVAELLAHLEINRRVEVAIGDDVETDKSHILNDGDQVHIFTTIGGG